MTVTRLLGLDLEKVRNVFSSILSERRYQEMRKSRDNGCESHSVEEYLLFMEDYLHEARNVASRTWGPEAKLKTLEVLRKVTTLGVACMEEHGAPQRKGFDTIVYTLHADDVSSHNCAG